MEIHRMFRKSLLALTAIAALGAAALSPTTASAGWGKKWGWHGHWHGHHHFHKPYWGYAAYGYGYKCFFVKKYTPWGVKFKKVCY
jgi:hypothetical protein